MKRNLVFLSVALAVILPVCLTAMAKATLITNGDFSTGTLAGWTTYGNLVATDYTNLPAASKNTWDLSAWNSRMDGTFALFEPRGGLNTRIAPAPDSSSFFLSLDYALAWDRSKFVSPYDYGYFSVEVSGVTDDSRVHALLHKEITWGPFSGLEKGVLTGSLYFNDFFPYPNLVFKELLFDFNVFNPNLTLNQIVGVDNINLSVAPIPEPTTILLFGLGLAGIAGIRRRSQRVRIARGE